MIEYVYNVSDSDLEFIEDVLSSNPTGYAIEITESGIELKLYDDKLKERLSSLGFEPSRVRTTSPKEWFEASAFKPFELIEGVIVDPTGNLSETGKVVLRIKPGLAFGTGLHHTTKMCASLMVRILRSGMDVLDVGTGTGILAVMAKKLGAGRVVAVDIDPTAVEIARHHARLNGVEIDVVESDLLDKVSGKFDLIVANIVPEVLKRLADGVRDHMKPDGSLIVSGIDTSSREEILDEFRSRGFSLEHEEVSGDWIAAILK